MPVLPAASPRHIIHGAASAFTGSTGSPTSFMFAYGTWQCPDDGGLALYGIIASYQLAPLGDVSNLKDGGGSTFAHAIIDPGWKITASMLHSIVTVGATGPRRGSVITFSKVLDGVAAANRAFSAVASGSGAKAQFTIASTAGYVVGELVQVSGSYVGTHPVVSIDSATTITLNVPFGITSTGALSAPASISHPTFKAVVTSVSLKWEREGWRMMDIEAEARDSINLGNTYAGTINELSAVEEVIHAGD